MKSSYQRLIDVLRELPAQVQSVYWRPPTGQTAIPDQFFVVRRAGGDITTAFEGHSRIQNIEITAYGDPYPQAAGLLDKGLNKLTNTRPTELPILLSDPSAVDDTWDEDTKRYACTVFVQIRL